MTEPKKSPEGLKLLHIWRCGTSYAHAARRHYYDEWNNMRFTVLPQRPDKKVVNYDISKPLPYSDASFDAVYANHVLEHLTPQEGARFAAEIRRILKPSGIVRLVVPDLEMKCRDYLAHLDALAASDDPQTRERYRWSQLNLIDQMVRQQPTGALGEVLRKGQFDEEHVRETNGDVYNTFFPSNPRRWQRQSLLSRLVATPKAELFYMFLRRLKLLWLRRDPRKFREANTWMYDRLSLSDLLRDNGFAEVRPLPYKESDIPGWDRYQFDRSDLGDYPIEPSVYVEARRPNPTPHA